MAIGLNAPFPSFFDRAGKPLEGAFIYYGTVNLDPQNNPIAVFWDAALTIPAAQPIRTAGGFPVYNGTPGNLYSATDCSVRVLDRNGGFVYGLPSIPNPMAVAAVTRIVDTIALMLAIPKASLSDGTTVEALGYSAAADNGGGLFQWVSASSATANGGTIFASNDGGTGRWFRIYNEPISVLWFGVAADGTDQTTEILAVFTALGSSHAGVITSPEGVRFNANTVMAAIPDDTVFQGVVVFQTGTGYRQQVVFTADNPPDANTDTATSVLSSHYAGVTLNNTRQAGTASAAKGLVGWAWERGYFSQGSGGPRTQQQLNYTKLSVRAAEHGGEGVAGLVNVLRSPEFVGAYEEWFTGIAVTNGLYIYAPNGSFYLSNTDGTSSVAPTNTSGTATFGGISYTFISGQAFSTIFSVDECRRIGTNQADTGTTHNWEQSPDDTENFVVRYTAQGASKQFFMYFSPTTAGGAVVALPYMNATESVGVRWLDSPGSRVLFGMTDARGLNLSTWGRTTFTATNNSTTPSIANGSRVLLSNTNPTSITDFTGYLPDQNIRVYATNGNTTLVHSGLLYLKGAANAVLANGNMIELERDYANGGWIEASRNF